MISLVDETFNDSRNIRDARRIVGKEEKSNGRSMKRVVEKMRIANAKDNANPASSTHEGIGRIIMIMIAINAIARSTVGLKRAVLSAGLFNEDILAAVCIGRQNILLLRVCNKA